MNKTVNVNEQFFTTICAQDAQNINSQCDRSDIEQSTSNKVDMPDLSKKPKPKKLPNNQKKHNTSETQETVTAQKYYISSLECKINHLENMISVMQKNFRKSEW